MLKLLPLLLLSLLFASPSSGQPLIFSRATITIETTQLRPAEAEAEASTADAPQKETKEPEMVEVPITYEFSVDVRPQASLKLDWFHSLADIRSDRGVLVTLEDETPMLDWAKIHSAVDLLFIQPSGRIQAIVPNVVPSSIDAPFEMDAPIGAVLFISAESASVNSIEPGDVVKGKMFRAKPVVLQ